MSSYVAEPIFPRPRCRPTGGAAIALFALVMLSGGIPSSMAQAGATRNTYVSPTDRGLRPSHHRPTLPAPLVSMHGLSHFPVGSQENLGHSIQPGPGFRVSAAWQTSKRIAVEFSYSASTHEATVEKENLRGFFQGFHLNAILFPFEESSLLQPFFTIGTQGLGFFSEQISASKMSGFGFGLGAGASVFLSRHTAISVRLRYLGTFVYEAEASFFGDRADDATFLNLFAPEMGLVFFL